MEDAGRKTRGTMLGELLEQMESAQGVASRLGREHPEYAALAEMARSATELVSMAYESETHGQPKSYSYTGEAGELVQRRAQGGDEVQQQQGIDGYEQLVNTFAEQAKTFMRLWGPAGGPMIMGVEAWAQMQHAYIKWLKQTTTSGTGV
jgi:hypothetical protein